MWKDHFNQEQEPSKDEIRQYIHSDLWEDLCSFIETTYQVAPTTQYSKCSAQPGWNIKYKKGGKALCTLYPMKNFFIALLVIGSKEQNETELILPLLSPYLQDLYGKTSVYCGSRWLMIEVRDQEVLEDVKKLIEIRMRKELPKKRGTQNENMATE